MMHPRPKPHVVVNVLLSLGVLAAAGAAGWYLLHHKPAPKSRAQAKVIPQVRATAIQPLRTYRVAVVGYGSVRPRVSLKITPEVTGRVAYKAPGFDSGKYVRAGQVLFRIDPIDYRLARDIADQQVKLLAAGIEKLHQEKTNLQATRVIEQRRKDLAKQKLDNAKASLAGGAASQSNVDSAEETYQARKAQWQTIVNQLALIDPQLKQLTSEKAIAQAKLAQAQKDLGRTEYRSPVTGQCRTCSIQANERVQAGAVCGELYGTAVMEVPVSIPSRELQWIDPDKLARCRRGQAGVADRISADVYPQQPIHGQWLVWRGCVERIEAGLEAQTRMATLVVQVHNAQTLRRALPPASRGPTAASGPTTSPATSPAGTMLDINVFCKVVIHGKVVTNAFILPRSAVQPDSTVYLIDPDGRLARKTINVARFTDDRALVLADGGIRPGDRIVQDDLTKPVLGMRVDARDAPASAPATGPASR